MEFEHSRGISQCMGYREHLSGSVFPQLVSQFACGISCFVAFLHICRSAANCEVLHQGVELLSLQLRHQQPHQLPEFDLHVLLPELQKLAALLSQGDLRGSADHSVFQQLRPNHSKLPQRKCESVHHANQSGSALPLQKLVKVAQSLRTRLHSRILQQHLRVAGANPLFDSETDFAEIAVFHLLSFFEQTYQMCAILLESVFAHRIYYYGFVFIDRHWFLFHSLQLFRICQQA